jgi:hypothetical protein
MFDTHPPAQKPRPVALHTRMVQGALIAWNAAARANPKTCAQQRAGWLTATCERRSHALLNGRRLGSSTCEMLLRAVLVLLLGLCMSVVAPAEGSREARRRSLEATEQTETETTVTCPRQHPFASADGKECCIHKYSSDDECHPSYDAVPCPSPKPCGHFVGGRDEV